MPVYDFNCPECGPFEALVPMAKYAEPCSCPDCSASAPRILLNAPRIAIMDGARRIAHSTNEQAADSPKRSSHAPGCSCCSSTKGKIGSGTLRRPDGSKSFPRKRPWMISH